MMFGQQRVQFRQAFVDVWRKTRRGTPLEPLEQAIAGVIGAHPQFQEMLAQPASLSRDYPVEGEESNPFLHMGMHISIIEQITSDRPAGIRAAYDDLRGRFADTHGLEHAMMQCLAESLLEARERNRLPDEQRYLSCVRLLKAARR